MLTQEGKYGDDGEERMPSRRTLRCRVGRTKGLTDVGEGGGEGGIQDGSPGPDLKDHVVVSSSDRERKAGGQTCLEGR